MTLVILSVLVIVFLIAVLAIYLFVIGALLNHVADNLDDCLKSVQQISRQAAVIGPGVKRLNDTGGKLVGAMPLLYGGAEKLIAKLTPAVTHPATAAVRVGYMDEPSYQAKHSSAASPAALGSVKEPALAAAPAGVGYMDR